MMSFQKAVVAIVLFLVVFIVGWVANIVQVISSMGDNEVTTLFITKIVGILIAPLGAILGWIGIF